MSDLDQTHNHNQLDQNSTAGLPSSGAVWTNPNPPLHRGRAPKDPMAVIAKYECATIEELETKFREYLDNPPAPAEHCTCELTLWAGASFLVTVPSDSATPGPNPHPRPNMSAGMLQPVAELLNAPTTPDGPRSQQLTMSVLDALQPMPDPKDSMKRQRAISKVCVAAVQRVDGFRYSFHNNWRSGEDNAYRFSYYCNDSLLNKDRVANGKAGSQGRRATKPVYDCKGVLSIKFSATRSCIDVVYKHIRCHETYEDRAPPPRKESRRRAAWELSNPGRTRELREPREPRSLQPNQNIEMVPPSRKRQRKEKAPRTSVESDMRLQSMKSLLELIRDEEPEKAKEAEAAANAAQNNATAGASASGPARAATGPRSNYANICAICLNRRSRCDGTKPKCKPCADKDWPCFYTPLEKPSTQQQHQQQQQPANVIVTQAPTGTNDTMQRNAITALAVASQNEDLQQALNNTRQELLKAQKETYELRTKLTESQEKTTRLEAEVAQHNSAQVSANSNGYDNQDRGNHQTQQLTGVSGPGVYQTPPYQNTGNQMYQNHQAPSQAAHTRAPTYPQNNRPPVTAWAPTPVYGYQPQPTQQQGLWGANMR